MSGEHDLIARIRRRVGSPPAWVSIGIGDDAAVIEPERGAQIVITTDSLVEDVHFSRRLTPLDAVGEKALAVNLSDLAAMGASPRACLLTLAVPDGVHSDEIDQLTGGLIELASRAGAPLVGGNVTRSPGPLMVDVTALGSVRPRRVLRRSGGRAGDELFVTGQLGAAAAGLAALQSGEDRSRLDIDFSECIRRYERPEARLKCGIVVGRRQAATAAIDLSDGLADGVHHIAAESGLGAVIDAGDVPIHAGASEWARRHGGDALGLALGGGEDYELLFAVSRRGKRNFLAAVRQSGDVMVTRIGRLRAEPGVWIDRDGRLEPLGTGFVHF